VLVGVVIAAVFVAAQVAVAARPMRAVSRAADSVAASAGRWSIVPSATQSKTTIGKILGVSCVTAMDCTAVGAGGVGEAGKGKAAALVENWNGTAWSIIPSPSALGAFSAVSCVSAKDCAAVGTLGDGYDDRTLAEHWNGNKWSIIHSPSGGALDGVSCVSARDCTAVGGGSTDALVEHWNGAAWSIAPSPTSAGELFGVSCVSATRCAAVGTPALIEQESS